MYNNIICMYVKIYYGCHTAKHKAVVSVNKTIKGPTEIAQHTKINSLQARLLHHGNGYC